MTPAQLIDHCATALLNAGVSFGQGTLTPEDEAAWLVLWRLGIPLDTDTQTLCDEVSSQEKTAVLSLLAQRIEKRQPLAYLTQEAWLQGISFHVDERCLIPRSLIAEVLAEGSMDPWLHPQANQALDLCTGGGSLAILLAMAYPQMNVQALDISSDALAVAAINLKRHQLNDRVQLTLSDGLNQARGPFDLIVCNPPYVNAQSMSTLPAEFLAEPALALAGGRDGMDFIRQLLQDVPQYLTQDGVLVLEIGHERVHFESAFPQLAPVWLSTSAGDDQVLLLTHSALTQSGFQP